MSMTSFKERVIKDVDKTEIRTLMDTWLHNHYSLSKEDFLYLRGYIIECMDMDFLFVYDLLKDTHDERYVDETFKGLWVMYIMKKINKEYYGYVPFFERPENEGIL